ncbi:MAG: pyruvate kinase [Candidatus Pacebacteria bacterium]|nr:pyruvate kinase [Candidatus Paceibacterota bacterium]
MVKQSFLFPHKLTKIVATIGPATEEKPVIEKMISAGMNVARFNTKHGTPAWHQERIQRVRQVAQKMKIAVGVLLDLQGPEIRINLPGEASFELKEGEQAVFSANKHRSDDNLILIPELVIETLQEGNLVLLDDGICEFEIVKKTKDRLVVQALSDFTVQHRKTMNTPGVVIDMPSLIKNDLVQLDGLSDESIDFVGLSFVRDVKDIEILRKELKKRKITAQIVAKIENQAALDNLDEIITASDAIMVARGDLAVEVPFEQLAYWQKLIISKCRYAGVPVITATQMLKSMVDHPRPTRAEVSDVANAVYDYTSAVMLSEETTIGQYPVKSIATQAKIVAFNEQQLIPDVEDWLDETDAACIAHAAVYVLSHRADEIDTVICLTETGATAKLLSRFRPRVPVKAVTSNQKTYQAMSVLYGVIPQVVDWSKEVLVKPKEMIKALKKQKLVSKGQTVLVIHGDAWKKPGSTDTLSIVKIN